MRRLLSKIFAGKMVHHAYLVESRECNAHIELAKCISDIVSVSYRGNPDFIVETYATLTIEDARFLRERVHRKALTSTVRLYVLFLHAITTDAGDALLKTLEEPPAGTTLFIIVPSRDLLHPTLRSRFVYLGTFANGRSNEYEHDAVLFLNSDANERLRVADNIAKGERSDAGRFLDAVITSAALARQNDATRHIDVFSHGSLNALVTARMMITEGGVGVKQILQYAALAVAERSMRPASSQRTLPHGTMIP